MLKFEPESAAGIMHTDVITLMEDFTVEKSISLIYKEMLSDRAAMKEIKQILSYILLTQEEIMNVLNGHIEQQSEEDIEKKMASDAEEYAEEEMKDSNKKWN
jgi:Mg/Co/Ni transporter MgtE